MPVGYLLDQINDRIKGTFDGEVVRGAVIF
jgi:hypothetical protein